MVLLAVSGIFTAIVLANPSISMKFHLLRAIVASLFIGASPVALVSQTTLPYSVDFESNQGFLQGPLDGQDGWSELTGLSRIESSVVYSGLNSVTIEASTPRSSVRQSFAELIGEDVVYLDFFLRPVAETDPPVETLVDVGFTKLRFVKEGSLGRLEFLDGDGLGGGSWISSNQEIELDATDRSSSWMRVTIRIDVANWISDVYLNGNISGIDLGRVDASYQFLSEAIFFGHASEDVYLDYGYVGSTNPLFSDLDNDGLDDDWETLYGLSTSTSSRAEDLDFDGLTNIEEYIIGSNPNSADSDNDGLSDGLEIAQGRDPLTSEPDSFLLSFEGLRLFLRADEGVAVDGDGKVSDWQDLSGNGFDAVQSSSAYRPLFVSSQINGNPVVRFDGHDDHLNFGNLMSGAVAGEVFVVLESTHDAAPSQSYFDGYGLWRFAAAGSSYEGNGYYSRENGHVYESFGRASSVNIGDPSASLDQPNLYNVVSDTSLWAVRMNGALEYETLSNTPAFRSDPSLGRGSSYYSKSFDGDVAEIIIFDRALSDNERNLVSAYLGEKYDLVGLAAPVDTPMVEAIGVTPTRIQVSWNDIGSGVTYRVERSNDGTTWQTISEVRNQLGYLDSALSSNTEFRYRVTAMRPLGESSPSSEAVATTLSDEYDDLPVNGMKSWLRADTVAPANGKVQRMNDQSGNDFSSWQNTHGLRPVYISDAISGKPAIRFDGSNDYMSMGEVLAGADAGEIFAVVNATHDVAPNQSYFDGYGLWRFASPGSSYEGHGYFMKENGEVQESFGRSSSVNIGNPSAVLNQPNLYNVASGSDHWAVRLNGVVQYYTGTNSASFRSDPSIGRGSSSYSKSFHGEIAEILIFDRVLNDNERETVARYLGLKYGLPGMVSPEQAPIVEAHGVSPTRIQLSWSDASASTAGGIRYLVERAESSGPWVKVADVIDNFGYLDDGLVAGQEYSYRITAISPVGSSPVSEVIVGSTLDDEYSDIPLAGMRAWYRGDSVIASNGLVSRLIDRSSRASDAWQSTVSARPMLISDGVNGNPSIRYDGSDDFIQLGDVMNGATAGEIFAVLEATHDEAPNASYFDAYGLWRFSASGTSYEGDSRFPRENGEVYENFGRTGGRASLGNPGHQLNQPNLYNVYSKQDDWGAYLNGELQYRTLSNTPGFRSNPSIGRGTSYYGKSFHGDIAEIIVFDRVLNDEERQALNRYLGIKYDLPVWTLPSVAPTLKAVAVSPSRIQLSWNDSGDGVLYKVERAVSGGEFEVVDKVRNVLGYLDEGLVPETAYSYRITEVSPKGSSPVSSVETVATLSAVLADLPLDGMKMWIRGDSVCETADQVMWFKDRSGSENDVWQKTQGYRPKLIPDAVNGQPAIRYDGKDDYIDIGDLMNGATEGEVFALLNASYDEAPSASYFDAYGLWRFSGAGASYEGDSRFPRVNGEIYGTFGRTAGAAKMLNLTEPLNQPNLYNVYSKDGEWGAIQNGVSQYVTYSNTPGFRSDISIGRGGSYYGKSFHGDISEVIVFDRVLSSEEREALNRYFGLKYALPAWEDPEIPLEAHALAVSPTRVQLSWSDLGSGIVYRVEKSTDGGDWEFVKDVRGNFGFLDEGLEAGTSYTYRVTAISPRGSSDAVGGLSVTTLSSGFSDFDLTDVRFWLRADSVISGGATVQRVQDLSGSSAGGSQNSQELRPILVADAINGQPVIRFDGNNDYINLPNVMDGSTSAEVFAIVDATYDQAPSSSNFNGYGLWRFSASGASYEGNNYFPRTNGDVQESFGRTSQINIGNLGAPLDQANLYNVSSAAGEWIVRLNGAQEYATASNTVGFRTDPSIGRGSSSYSKSFHGDIAEILIFDGVLDSDTRDAVNAYFSLKYNLSGLQPPSAPSVSVVSIGGSMAQLSWDGEIGGVEYWVERRTPTSNWITLGSVVDQYGYLDQAVEPNQSYSYRIVPKRAGIPGYGSDEIVVEIGDDDGLSVPAAGMTTWLRADNTVVSQGSVQVWTDSSGNGNDATQDDSSKRPLLVPNAIGGQAVLRFDGNDDFLLLPDLMAGAVEGEVFAVVKATFDSAPNTSYFNGYGLWRFGSDDVGYEGDSLFPSTSGTVSESFGRTSAVTVGDLGDSLVEANLYNVLSAPDFWSVRLNGSLEYVSQDNIVAFRSDPSVGNGSTNYGKSFRGDVAEVIVYNRRLTDEERDGVSSYLRMKYSLSDYERPVVSEFNAVAVSAARVQLSWDGPLGDVIYSIERKSGLSEWETVGEVRDQYGYLDSGLNADTEYLYNLSVKRAGLPGDVSSEVSARTTPYQSLELPEESLRLWLSADQAVSGPSGLQRWVNRVDANEAGVQNTIGKRPSVLPDQINGQAVVRFDGDDDLVQLFDVLSGVEAAEVYAILDATYDDAPNASYFNGYGLWRFAGTDASSEGGQFYPDTSGQIIESFGRNSSVALGEPFSPLSAPNLYHVASAPDMWSVSLNDKVLYSTDSNTVSFRSDPVLGAGSANYGKSFHGDLAEILVFDRTLTEDERNRVVFYLKSKYGLLIGKYALADSDPDGDFDGDGLTNAEETYIYFSNPKLSDSDGDGTPDGGVFTGLDPLLNRNVALYEDDGVASGSLIVSDLGESLVDGLTLVEFEGQSTFGSISSLYGDVVVGADGSFSYTLRNGDAVVQALQEGEMAAETFSFKVRDYSGATATPTLTIQITGVNDVPVIVDSWSEIPIEVGEFVEIDLTQVFDDADSNLSYQIDQVDSGGIVLESGLPDWASLDDVGLLSGTPVESSLGELNLRIIASDGLATVDYTLEIVVFPSGSGEYVPVLESTLFGDSGEMVSGSFTLNNLTDVYRISANGSRDGIGFYQNSGYYENMFFAHVIGWGDGEISARIDPDSWTGANSSSRVGLMIREGVGSRDPFGWVCRQPENQGTSVISRSSRSYTRGSRAESAANPSMNYVKIAKTGNVLTFFESIDGEAWIEITTATVDLPTYFEIGIGLMPWGSSGDVEVSVSDLKIDGFGVQAPVENNDADNDGLLDLEEVALGLNHVLFDTDFDGIGDGDEVLNGLDPFRNDAFEDLDKDRFPNIFETAHGSLADDPQSIPVYSSTQNEFMPNYYVVDPQAQEESEYVKHTIQAAVSLADTNDIVEVRPGVYVESVKNGVRDYFDYMDRLVVGDAPSIFLFSTDGAASTVIDSDSRDPALSLHGESVVDGFTLTGSRSLSEAVTTEISDELSALTARLHAFQDGEALPEIVSEMLDQVEAYFVEREQAIGHLFAPSVHHVSCGVLVDVSHDNPEARDAKVTVKNCLVQGNMGVDAGGLYLETGRPLVLNCTITRNWASSTGGGIGMSNSTGIDVVNSILWNSGRNQSLQETEEITRLSHDINIRNSIVRDLFVPSNSGWADLIVSNSSDQKPKLLYGHLVTGSVGIDEGTNSEFAATDLDGEGRLGTDADPVDIGVDEYSSADSDADGLPDWLEATGDLDSDGDFDGDTLSNLFEYSNAIDPLRADSDGDGLNDAQEIAHGTSRIFRDSDFDGISDGYEVENGLSPTVWDRDGDTDGDGFLNVYEYAHGTLAGDPASFPEYLEMQDSSGWNYFVVDSELVEETDYQKKTIQAAVAAAGMLDIIEVKPGTYYGHIEIGQRGVYSYLSGIDREHESKTLMIFSTEGPDKTIIDAREEWTAVTIVDSPSLLRGFTITNGSHMGGGKAHGDVDGFAPPPWWMEGGGGVYVSMNGGFTNAPHQPRIENCVIRGNKAAHGGGVYSENGAPNFVNCTIVDNYAMTKGSGIYTGTTSRNGFVPGPIFTNSIVWNPGMTLEGEEVKELAGTVQSTVEDLSTITFENCIVRGELLNSISSNVIGEDPLLIGSRLSSASPAIDSGATTDYALQDFDGQSRLTAANLLPDIGADEFDALDTDSDGLPDWLEALGLVDPDVDFDGDGLSNIYEFSNGFDPFSSDGDGDGLSDFYENEIGSDPRWRDSDFDIMPDGWEYVNGLNPVEDDAYGDLDRDRYPNVFEFLHGDGALQPIANDATVIPLFSDSQANDESRIYLVDHRYGFETEFRKQSISAAIVAAETDLRIEAGINTGHLTRMHHNIILVNPGVYGERFEIKEKTLLISSAGARDTVIDPTADPVTKADISRSVRSIVRFYDTAFVDGFTFRNNRKYSWSNYGSEAPFGGALYIRPEKWDFVRISNSLIHNNQAVRGGGIYQGSGTLEVLNCTVADNEALGNTDSGKMGAGFRLDGDSNTRISNSIFWNPANTSNFSMTTGVDSAYHFTANLIGSPPETWSDKVTISGLLSEDPLLTPSYHLSAISPAIDAGSISGLSNFDLDLENRMLAGIDEAVDVGVDEFSDFDGDGLPDWLEVGGGLDPLMDQDSDGLTNLEEYLTYGYDPLNPDMDGDLILDGEEIALGTDPLNSDSDFDGIPDNFEIANGLNPTDATDATEDIDRDSYPNVYEYAHASDMSDADSVPSPTSRFVYDEDLGEWSLQEISGMTPDSPRYWYVDYEYFEQEWPSSNAMLEFLKDLSLSPYTIVEFSPGVYSRSYGPRLEGGTIEPNYQGIYAMLLLGSRDTGDETIFDVPSGCAISGDSVFSHITVQRGDANGGWGFELHGEGGRPRLNNCVVRGFERSLVTFGSVKPTLSNCTLCEYGDGTIDGSGIKMYSQSELVIDDSIIWSSITESSGFIDIEVDSGASITVNNSIVRDAALSNLITDPLLDQAGRLTAGSPAIASGRVGLGPLRDIDGELRDTDGLPDIGADEYNPVPVAELLVTPDHGSATLEVSASASGSYDPNGQITNFEFDFGDDTEPVVQTDFSLDHSFQLAGSFNVSVKAYDAHGSFGMATVTVTVSNQDPVANFSATPVSGSTPVIVDFDASASFDADGEIVSYEWHFGDGSDPLIGDTSDPLYTFTDPGQYSVLLVVTDNLGAQSSSVVNLDFQGYHPAIELITPWPGESFSVGDIVEFSAEISDGDGTVEAVRFYANDVLLETQGALAGTDGVWSLSWAPADVDTYSLRMEADDNEGRTGSLDPFRVYAGGGSVDADTDGDGLPDVWELANGFDPNVAESESNSDGDYASRKYEYLHGTDPASADTDGDGIPDGLDPYPTVAAVGTPPVIRSIRPVSGTTSFTDRIDVSFEVVADQTLRAVRVDGVSAVLLEDGLWHRELRLRDGDYTINLLAETMEGHVAREDLLLNVDAVDPVVELVGHRSGDRFEKQNVRLVFLVEDQAQSLTVNGVPAIGVGKLRYVWARLDIGSNELSLVLEGSSGARSVSLVSLHFDPPTGYSATHDSDGDGVSNEMDLYPENFFEWADADADGVGSNRDIDDGNPTETRTK